MAKRKSRELKRFVDQELHKFFVAGGNEILKGDFVGIKPGYGTVRPWNPGDVFAGVAYNDSSQCGDPCKSDAVMVYTLGDFVLTSQDSIWVDNVGKPVYLQSHLAVSTTLPASLVGYPMGVCMAIVNDTDIIVRLRTFPL